MFKGSVCNNLSFRNNLYNDCVTERRNNYLSVACTHHPLVFESELHMASVSRRQLLLGAAASASFAVAPALLKAQPEAQALAPSKHKFHYSLNAKTNRYRYGILSLPRKISTSVPVAVLVHGGSWGTKGNVYSIQHVARELAENGVAVWNIEYRSLGTGGGWPTTYADVCDAIDHLLVLKFLYALNLDLDRVYLVGHSAGSQLAALAIGQSPKKVSLGKLIRNTEFVRKDNKQAQLKNLRGDRVRGMESGSSFGPTFGERDNPHTAAKPSEQTPAYGLVGTGNLAGMQTSAPDGPGIPIRGFISLNGVLDVVDSANRSRFSSIDTFLGGTPREVPGNYYAANPFTHLPSGKRISVVQGGKDRMIPKGQGRKYVRAALSRGNTAHYHLVQSAKHNDFVYPKRNPYAFNYAMRNILQTMGLPYKPYANAPGKKRPFGGE